jgi:hypothetical protein
MPPVAASEAEVLRAIMAGLGARSDMRIFRNHVGAGWTGRAITSSRREIVMIANAQRCTFGLAPGSSDLIGWRSIEITPDMVGKRVAVFVAIETKSPRGRVTPEQHAFLDTATRMGALAGVARSVDDATKILEVKHD